MISSPGYNTEFGYPLNVACQWILDSGERNLRISVKVTMLDLEPSEKCVKDSLSFEDIGGRSGVNQDPFSGALVLSNQQMNLRDYHFRMVWNGLYQGFR